MSQYLEIVKELIRRFENIAFEQVPREQNAQADALAGLGSSFKPTFLKRVPIVHVHTPAIQKIEISILHIHNPEPNSWTTPYYEWFRDSKLPSDKITAKAFSMKASRFVLINNFLFKKSLAGPYLRCLEPAQAAIALGELHQGECGNHAGGRSLASKALRTGYYWPTMRKDAIQFSKKCDSCQKHAHMILQPAELLHTISAPWPFMKWGMDIVGKLPEAPGQKVFMLAMTDYFSKWIEAEAYRSVTEKEVISFIKRNIISRYGVPSVIRCDNGTQFISHKTIIFCAKWNIELIHSTPYNLKSNDQAESSNKIVINIHKCKLMTKRGRWAEELPLVLLADRTTPKTSTGRTPFSLVYGCEAVIPT